MYVTESLTCTGDRLIGLCWRMTWKASYRLGKLLYCLQSRGTFVARSKTRDIMSVGMLLAVHYGSDDNAGPAVRSVTLNLANFSEVAK